MRREKKMDAKLKLFVMMICLTFLCGCVNIQEESESKISNTEIRIGDSPAEDFKHVNLTFSDVKVYSDKIGWINVPLDITTIDLMYLHKYNLTKTLGFGKLKIGNYSQLRIAISNATGIKNDGERVYFNVSSNILQIQHMFKFDEGDNTISIDIDLSNSIHEYESGEYYILLPVISELNVSYVNGTMIRFRNRERIINYGNGTQITLQDENTLQNMIGNRKPTIDVVVNGKRGNTFQFRMNQSITLNASGTFDIDNDPLIFSWDFGDNTSRNGNIVTHSYSKEGTYQIHLRVSDTDLEDMMVIIVTVIKTGSPDDNNKDQGNSSGNNPPYI
jgi:hypothetical protein